MEKTIESEALYDVFATFGNVISCKVVGDEHGSKGYAYVQCEEQDATDRAIQRLNAVREDKQLTVEPKEVGSSTTD